MRPPSVDMSSILGRSFLVGGVCRSLHFTGLGRPAFFVEVA